MNASRCSISVRQLLTSISLLPQLYLLTVFDLQDCRPFESFPRLELTWLEWRLMALAEKIRLGQRLLTNTFQMRADHFLNTKKIEFQSALSVGAGQTTVFGAILAQMFSRLNPDGSFRVTTLQFPLSVLIIPRVGLVALTQTTTIPGGQRKDHPILGV